MKYYQLKLNRDMVLGGLFVLIAFSVMDHALSWADDLRGHPRRVTAERKLAGEKPVCPRH